MKDEILTKLEDDDKVTIIDSEKLRVHYGIKERHIIIMAGNNGNLSLHIRNWDKLKNEIDDILEVFR